MSELWVMLGLLFCFKSVSQGFSTGFSDSSQSKNTSSVLLNTFVKVETYNKEFSSFFTVSKCTTTTVPSTIKKQSMVPFSHNSEVNGLLSPETTIAILPSLSRLVVAPSTTNLPTNGTMSKSVSPESRARRFSSFNILNGFSSVNDFVSVSSKPAVTIPEIATTTSQIIFPLSMPEVKKYLSPSQAEDYSSADNPSALSDLQSEKVIDRSSHSSSENSILGPDNNGHTSVDGSRLFTKGPFTLTKQNTESSLRVGLEPTESIISKSALSPLYSLKASALLTHATRACDTSMRTTFVRTFSSFSGIPKVTRNKSPQVISSSSGIAQTNVSSVVHFTVKKEIASFILKVKPSVLSRTRNLTPHALSATLTISETPSLKQQVASDASSMVSFIDESESAQPLKSRRYAEELSSQVLSTTVRGLQSNTSNSSAKDIPSIPFHETIISVPQVLATTSQDSISLSLVTGIFVPWQRGSPSPTLVGLSDTSVTTTSSRTAHKIQLSSQSSTKRFTPSLSSAQSSPMLPFKRHFATTISFNESNTSSSTSTTVQQIRYSSQGLTFQSTKIRLLNRSSEIMDQKLSPSLQLSVKLSDTVLQTSNLSVTGRSSNLRKTSDASTTPIYSRGRLTVNTSRVEDIIFSSSPWNAVVSTRQLTPSSSDRRYHSRVSLGQAFSFAGMSNSSTQMFNSTISTENRNEPVFSSPVRRSTSNSMITSSPSAFKSLSQMSQQKSSILGDANLTIPQILLTTISNETGHHTIFSTSSVNRFTSTRKVMPSSSSLKIPSESRGKSFIFTSMSHSTPRIIVSKISSENGQKVISSSSSSTLSRFTSTSFPSFHVTKSLSQESRAVHHLSSSYTIVHTLISESTSSTESRTLSSSKISASFIESPLFETSHAKSSSQLLDMGLSTSSKDQNSILFSKSTVATYIDKRKLQTSLSTVSTTSLETEIPLGTIAPFPDVSLKTHKATKTDLVVSTRTRSSTDTLPTVPGNISTEPPTAVSSDFGQIKLLIIVAIIPSVLLCAFFGAFLVYRRSRKRGNKSVYSIKLEYADENSGFRKRCVNSRLDLSLKGIHIDLEFPYDCERRGSYVRDSYSRGSTLSETQMRELQILSQECKENMEWISEVIAREMEASFSGRNLPITRDSVYSVKEKENYEPNEKLRSIVRRESSKRGRETVKWKIPVVQRRDSEDFDQRDSMCTDDTTLELKDGQRSPPRNCGENKRKVCSKSNLTMQDCADDANEDKGFQVQLSKKTFDDKVTHETGKNEKDIVENKPLTFDLNAENDDSSREECSSRTKR